MRFADYDITPSPLPNDGLMFADLVAKGRSGHLGHALVEYAPGCVLAFYSNCSGVRNDGHNGFGWMEYRRSLDAGQSWDNPRPLPFSVDTFLDGLYTVSCEKAACAPDGTIVLFATMNDSRGKYWGPWVEPRWLVSRDGGDSFAVAGQFPFKGRIFDCACRDGMIYALEFCNDGINGDEGCLPEHVYRLYRSADCGRSFEEVSVLPLDTHEKVYGTMDFAPDGALIVYIYDKLDEGHPPYTISRDGGKTWCAPRRAALEKRIRNPQLRFYDGWFLMYGRSGHYTPPQNFVLYTSPDGENWDEGTYICERKAGNCFYSNSVIVHTPQGGTRLLIQASDALWKHRANVKHWWLENLRPHEARG